MQTRAIAIAVLLACGAFSAAALGAAKEPTAKPLALKKVEGLTNGRLAYVVGKTTRDGQRFYASNLLVTQPVIVTLKSDDPANDIRLEVTKTQWSKAEREVSTGAKGRVQLKFRTQGEFGLAVSGSDAGKPYRMTVWIGDEVKRPMASVVVPKSKWKGTAAMPAEPPAASAAPAVATSAPPADKPLGGGSLVVWLIAGLLVVIAALLFALLRKKREH